MSSIFQPARYELNKQIKKYAGVVHGRVLDVGAGPGNRYRGLFSCDEYVKMDIEGTPNIQAFGTAEHIPFADRSFDSIVCTQVISDVYDVPQAFKEMSRVLKPGGVLLLTSGFMDPMNDDPGEYWRFTENAFRALATGAGFSIEILEPRGGIWSVRAQMIVRYWIDRLDAYKKWYRPLANIISKAYCAPYLLLDRIDHSRTSRRFPHGYLIVGRKPTA